MNYLENVEKTIGYFFKNKDLLQQAFVRRSYSEEKGGQNNEVLEFIGDKALDLAVIRVMMERFGEITDSKDYLEFKLRNPKYFKTKKTEGQFTDIKKDLVQKRALARSMENLGFQNELIMGNGDIANEVEENDSVKEDLFEAIIGAVALDSSWNMDIITEVVKTMIDFEAYFNHQEDEDLDNYVGLLQEWAYRHSYDLPSYEYIQTYNEYICCVSCGDIIISIRGRGSSKAKARKDAAFEAYIYLEKNGLIENKYVSEIGEPDEYESLRQINELYQKGLISEPEFNFRKSYDEGGNTIWDCLCRIDSDTTEADDFYYSKKDAKRSAAYEMLCKLTQTGEYEIFN